MSDTGVVGRLRAHQSTLWLVALLLYGLGDLVTTVVGVAQPGIGEIGPVAGPVLDAYGTSGLVLLKSGTLAASYAVWRFLGAPHRVGIPLGLAVVGLVVTSWNTALIWVTW